MQKRIREKIRYDLNQEKKNLKAKENEYVIVEKWITETMKVIRAKKNLEEAHFYEIVLIILGPIMTFIYCHFALLPLEVILLLLVLGGGCTFYQYKKTSDDRNYLKKHPWKRHSIKHIQDIHLSFCVLRNRHLTSIQEQKQKIELLEEILEEEKAANLLEKSSIQKSIASEFDEWVEEIEKMPIEDIHFEFEREAIPKIKVLK